MSTDSQAVEQSQHLTFLIAGEEYALGILRVKEIIQYDTLTRVPRTPPWVRGVINLRGSVVPVVDLAVKFGLPESTPGKSTCIVMTETELGGEPTVMGILADAVSQVVDLRPEDIQPPPSFGTAIRVDYIVGMGRAGKKFVLMLDVDKVLADDGTLAAAPQPLQTDGAADDARGATAPGA